MSTTDLSLILSALGILLALNITPTAARCYPIGALLAAALTRPDPKFSQPLRERTAVESII